MRNLRKLGFTWLSRKGILFAILCALVMLLLFRFHGGITLKWSWWGERSIRRWSEVEVGVFGGLVWLLGGMSIGVGVRCDADGGAGVNYICCSGVVRWHHWLGFFLKCYLLSHIFHFYN